MARSNTTTGTTTSTADQGATTAQPAQGGTAYSVGDLVQVAPGDLLTDRNIREATADEALIASVKALGVLEPITAARTTDGDLRVRHGHRRVHAALQANATQVPVYIAVDEHDTSDTTAEAHRLIAQRDENTHRAALSTAEDIAVVAQLAAFGLSAAKIAKQARIGRAEVDAALAVAKSPLAAKATERYDHLTLDQAQTVAEFEDDAEAVKALVVASSEGRFEHVASRLRHDRDEAQARDAITQALTADGVTVVEAPGWSSDTPVPLTRLKPTPEADHRYGNDPARPDDAKGARAHHDCPGHVAWLQSEWVIVNPDGTEFDEDEPHADDEEACEAYEARAAVTEQRYVPVAVYGCADPVTHGHRSPASHAAATGVQVKAADMSEEQREAARAKRALVIENNKAWDAAEPVRRDWIASLAKAKTAPKGTARFLATAMCQDPTALGNVGGNHLAAEWLGKGHGGYGYADLSPAKSATDNRCQVLALVQVLGCYEADLTRDSWRGDGTHSAVGRYLRFLASAGYALSDVETYAASDQTPQ